MLRVMIDRAEAGVDCGRRDVPQVSSGVFQHARHVLLLACAIVALAMSAPLWAADAMSRQTIWRIDAKDSRVTFQLRALGVVGIEGTLTSIAGEVWRDADGEWVEVHIPLSTLKMGSERRRRWALSDEFFSAAKHPELKFTARLPAGKAISDMEGALKGTLVLRGVDGAVQVVLAKPSCGAEDTHCLVHAEARVSRSRFGMRSRSVVLSDTVALDLRLQLERVSGDKNAAKKTQVPKAPVKKAPAKKAPVRKAPPRASVKPR